MKFPFLASFILLCIVMNLLMRRTSRKTEEQEASFWEKELQSNNVRKKSLENLEYIHIPFDLLPFGTAGDDKTLQDAENELTALKDEKIVNLTGISNTDLKLEYGAPNITELSRYDQNYTTLVTTLQKWADELSNLNEEDAAFRIMEYMIEIKCDIGKTYRMLGKKYLKENNTEAFDNLIKTISGTRSMNKEYIKASLEEMRTKAEE